MFKKNRTLLTLIFCLLLYTILSPGNLPVPAEDMATPSGLALDLEFDEKNEPFYRVSISLYTFNKKDQVSGITISGNGKSLAETRETRQLTANHKIITALEKVILYSEDIARSGLGEPINMLFTNELVGDMGWMVVCKGRAEDVLKFKVKDFPTSLDYIDGLVASNREQNFFSDNYKIIDAYVRVDAEGRSLVLPYVEIQNDKIGITGIALFKKNKMVKKLNMEETKIMNFLRENNARGTLIKQTGFSKQTSLYGSVKRKVRCVKDDDDNFIFFLDLEFTGDVINNTIYKNFLKEVKDINNFETVLADETEKKCYDFIRKMQKEYKVDCLELGRVAAAKYGRRTGVDWDKVVSNSEIRVHVKVNVGKFGRGQYAMD